ncbi:MAG: type I restriction enzyme HsdR N-terminal domain-containing protein [Candidatus Nitrospinota bacterium M3_3B_026]
MANIPKRIVERLSKNVKKFQPILKSARSRDVNEADTVTIVTDILSNVFGYNKYTEITSEHTIRGTFCDLAIEIDGSILLLIEVKAIGLDLKENHTRQAVNYAANQGVEWIALTNGVVWKIFRVTFSKPINKELVLEFDFLELDHKSSDDLECLYLLTRKGRDKSALKEYFIQRQAMSRYSLGAIILSDPVLTVIRRELKRVSPEVKLQIPEIKNVIMQEVLKREVIEGEKADEAHKKIKRAIKKKLKTKKRKAPRKTNSRKKQQDYEKSPPPARGDKGEGALLNSPPPPLSSPFEGEDEARKSPVKGEDEI